MAKRKVIQDSDDEDDANATGRHQPEVHMSSGEVDDPQSLLDQHRQEQFADASTGSTEILNREILAVHRSLIDHTPDHTRLFSRIVVSSASSSPSKGMKRAKTSIEEPRVKKRLKRYGTESGRDIFDFHEDSDEDISTSARRARRVKDPQSTGSAWLCSSGDTVALGNSCRQENQHMNELRPSNVDLMPPPPMSSTIVEEITSLEIPLQDGTSQSENTSGLVEPPMHDRLSRSPSFNSRMPSPTMSSRSAMASEKMVYSNESLRSRYTTNEAEMPGPKYSASGLSLGPGTEQPSNGGAVLDEKSSSILQDPYAPKSAKPVVLLSEMHPTLEENDELSLPVHGPETWSINQTTCVKAQRQREQRDHRKPSPSEAPGSDDLAIGIPKEQYQPRPSKSRSGRGIEDVIVPTDFSKRPEAMAKKKSKLFKQGSVATSNETGQKCEDPRGDEKVALDHELDGVKVNIAKPAETSMESPSDREVEETVPDPKPPEKANKTKKQRGRPKKEQASKTTGEELDVGDQHNELEPSEKTASTKKSKKGTKANPAAPYISEEIIRDSDYELDDVDKMIQTPKKTLKETSGNGTSTKPTEETVPSTSPSKTIVKPPQTPEKAGPPSSRGSDKHSPISSGNVAYRVGLSKKARIAPLLRIVRKA